MFRSTRGSRRAGRTSFCIAFGSHTDIAISLLWMPAEMFRSANVVIFEFEFNEKCCNGSRLRSEWPLRLRWLLRRDRSFRLDSCSTVFVRFLELPLVDLCLSRDSRRLDGRFRSFLIDRFDSRSDPLDPLGRLDCFSLDRLASLRVLDLLSLDLLDSLSVDFLDSLSLDLAWLDELHCDSSSVSIPDSRSLLEPVADDSPDSDDADDLLDERLFDERLADLDELVDSMKDGDFLVDATDRTVLLEKIDS